MIRNIPILFVLALLVLQGGTEIYAQSSDPVPATRLLDEVRKRRHIDVFEVRQMDIRDALDILSIKTGYSFKVDENVRGAVTVSLQNIDLYDVLKIIFDMNDLAFKEENGRIHVMRADQFRQRYGVSFGQNLQTKSVPVVTADPGVVEDVLRSLVSPSGKIIYNARDSIFILMDTPDQIQVLVDTIRQLDVPVETKAYRLRFKKAAEIRSQVKALLTPHIGRMDVEAGLNSLVVTDTPKAILRVDGFIETIDTQEQEIAFTSRTLQITLNEEYVQGVDWEAIVSDYQDAEFIGFDRTTKSPRLKYGTLNEEDTAVLVEALDTVGLINTVGNTQSRISDGQTLHLGVRPLDVFMDEELTDRSPYVSKSEVKLHITAQIQQEEDILLEIVPELVTHSENILNKNRIISNEGEAVRVAVETGSTIIIGGLFKDVVVESTRKIPLLGDLPFVGVAFRQEGEESFKSEIVVLIIPTLTAKED